MVNNILGRLVGKPGQAEKKGKAKASITRKDLRLFVGFALPVWKTAAFGLLLTFLIAIISSILPLTSKVFIDFVILKQGYDRVEEILSYVGMESAAPRVISFLGSIENVILLMICGAIVFFLLQGLRSFTMMRYEQELTFNAQSALFERVLRYPLSYYKTTQSGYLLSRIVGDVQRLQYLLSGLLVATLSQVFYLISSLAILLVLSPTITLIVACTLPFYLLINYYFSGKIKAVNHKEWELSAHVYRDIQELILGIEVIKSFVTNDRELGKVTNRLRDVIRMQITSRIISSASSSMMRIVQYSVMLFVMWYGAHEIMRGNLTVGDYVAFMSYILLLSGSVSSLFNSYLNLQPTMAALERLAEMFNIVPEYEKDDKDRAGKRPERINGQIKYSGVFFSYRANTPVLDDISFQLEKGETIALVGASGAGKTTMINLLLKFYAPQEGAIYLDGHDIKDLDTLWLRRQIAIVPQDVFLFDDTIENNIRYAKPSATREEVITAAKRAQIHDDIVRMENGYDTMAGERGAQLSTGQRQRISIARAFLKDAQILILDEPTSSLDIETERHLKGSMYELMKGRTTIVISHRMSLTDIADKVIVLSDNRIVQYGTRKELIAVEGPYRRMCAPDAVIG